MRPVHMPNESRLLVALGGIPAVKIDPRSVSCELLTLNCRLIIIRAIDLSMCLCCELSKLLIFNRTHGMLQPANQNHCNAVRNGFQEFVGEQIDHGRVLAIAPATAGPKANPGRTTRIQARAAGLVGPKCSFIRQASCGRSRQAISAALRLPRSISRGPTKLITDSTTRRHSLRWDKHGFVLIAASLKNPT